MNYSISKDFTFSAGHYLFGLPEGHPCANPHGHNYIVRIIIGTNELNDIGFVIDYGELRWFCDVIDKLDHTMLNDVVPFNPTAEQLAEYFCKIIFTWLALREDNRKFNVDIGVSETPKTWAWAGGEVVNDES